MNTKNKSLENPQTFQILKNEPSTNKIDKGRRLRWVTKEANFVEKKKNITIYFCRGGEKMKNANGHRGENERQ